MKDFINAHGLPGAWQASAQKWFDPLAETLAARLDGAPQAVPVVGIHGCQGSGKSTLGAYLVWKLGQEQQYRGISLSLDDFYLTKRQRIDLAQQVHPLLATRGVPGTHDVQLAHNTLDELQQGLAGANIPRFNKSVDDRSQRCETLNQPVHFIVLEGWCLGIPPQNSEDLATPINRLEAEEDSNGIWRGYVNQMLIEHYADLFQRVDQWIMLQAPGFGSVYNWRLQQEQKLANPSMNAQQLERFIQHYQRLTEHALNCMPFNMHYLFQLNDDREIISYSQSVECLADER